MKAYSVAIVGATGMVGQEFVKVLQQRRFPIKGLRLLASDRSAGRKVYFSGEELPVMETTNKSFKEVEIAFFSAGTDISASFAPVAARSGALVIDNSAAFRMEQNVPLVVPEVNPDDLRDVPVGIIANPNCSTIQMVVALHPLHKINPIKRIIVDTYQSVSGTGSAAIEELSNGSKLVLEGKTAIPHVYPHQIAFNILPHIDVFLDNGYSREEWKMVQETRKIMHAPGILVSATAVRVPVFVSHSEAIHVEFAHKISPDEVREILAAAPGVKVQDDPEVSMYPLAWAVAGQDDVFVGRIREDVSCDNGIAMWVVADNIRKGAALNAVQIAEKMIGMGLL
ncbi:MAG: aspartate-semialdehyde dehydrogenase [Chloroflexi bacterium]|nr:aspartate-semialdehyde dehydrogenase [Actinomycetota bacterium]MCL5959084.1 aspartate-semialdehyde dehydrogenase [Chloroflexota bacterium]